MEVLIDLFLSGITIFSFIFLLIKYLFLFILLLEPITLGPDRGEKASLVLIQIEFFLFFIFSFIKCLEKKKKEKKGSELHNTKKRGRKKSTIPLQKRSNNFVFF